MSTIQPGTPPTTTVQQYTMMSAATERRNLETKRGKLRFSLEVKQQPKQSRMCGVGEKNNRRPIDPPPAVVIQVNDGQVGYPDIDTMFLFVTVTLVHPDTLEAITVPAKENKMTPLVGVTNATIHRIVAPHHRGGPEPLGVFAFTDLSVRQEGWYRLQFNCYEVINGDAIHRAKVESDRFRVYAAKGFPGMEQSTPFTDVLKKHGIRVRVSKSIRTPKRVAQQVVREPNSRFNPENDPQRRVQMAARPAPYQTNRDAWRPRNYDHPRLHGPEGFSTPSNYHSSSGSGPVLPPPANARSSPEPSTTTPHYSEPYPRRIEYGPDNYQSQPPAPVYNERREEANYSEKWRYGEYRDSPRIRPREPQSNNQAQYGNSIPIPYSPPVRSYSPAPLAPPNPYSGPQPTRRPSQSFSPRGPRPSDSYGRRYSITQANSLPPFHFHSPELNRDMHPGHGAVQEQRHASHAERPNGMDYTGQQFQPPPSHVPMPEQWYNYNNSGSGYQGGTEGYRG